MSNLDLAFIGIAALFLIVAIVMPVHSPRSVARDEKRRPF